MFKPLQMQISPRYQLLIELTGFQLESENTVGCSEQFTIHLSVISLQGTIAVCDLRPDFNLAPAWLTLCNDFGK